MQSQIGGSKQPLSLLKKSDGLGLGGDRLKTIIDIEMSFDKPLGLMTVPQFDVLLS